MKILRQKKKRILCLKMLPIIKHNERQFNINSLLK